jgi:HlyD family secretion protein
LAEVLVEVGDQVDAGQILARLDDADAQSQIEQAQINLRLAELKLEGLDQEVDAADLASAQASLASAEADMTKLTSPPSEQELLSARESLRSAQEKLDDLLAGPDEDLVEIAEADLTLAEMALRQAQTAYDRVAHQPNIGSTQQASDLWQATTNYEKAQAEYAESLTGATDDEISDARAQVALAQAQLDELLAEVDPDEIRAAEARIVQALAQLDSLFEGVSPSDLESEELNVAQAALNLENAQRELAELNLTAPVTGTVLAVNAMTGEAVGTSALISLADLEQPLVQFWVEESDMSSVALGNDVNLVFEALPDLVYTGEIVKIDPALVTVDGTPAIQSWADIDLTAHPVDLISGMNADVEIVAGQALNAVLVPIQALRELAPETYAVFVVQPNGELEMRVVEVGLKDFVNAEILSGLEAGDTVSTGIEESSSEPEAPADQPPGPGGGIMRFMGG